MTRHQIAPTEIAATTDAAVLVENAQRLLGNAATVSAYAFLLAAKRSAAQMVAVARVGNVRESKTCAQTGCASANLNVKISSVVPTDATAPVANVRRLSNASPVCANQMLGPW